MFDWSLVFVCALVTARVTRFITKDDLIMGTREKVLNALSQPRESKLRFLIEEKLWYLVSCVWCVSIYVSAGSLLLSRLLWVDSVPAPVWSWLAVGMLAVVVLQFTDGDWEATVTHAPPKHQHRPPPPQ